MARGFMYVYERIFKEQDAMGREFGKIPVNGSRTSQADQRRIRRIISDSAYRVAQECSVIVSYPLMRIEGRKVSLGRAHIVLPDCRIVSIEQLRDIETGRSKGS